MDQQVNMSRVQRAQPPPRPSRMSRIFLAIVTMVALASLAGNAFLWMKLKALQDLSQGPEEQVKSLVAEVGKVMVLPTDEEPTTATVSDPEKLRDQAFFGNAQAGDKVLIYQKSRKAILWRPSTKKVIEVSGLNVTAPQSAPPAQ